VSTAGTDDASAPGLELKVGEWYVDPAGNQLRRNGEATRLEPKAIEVLVYLSQRAGRVVGREELLSAVWPGVIVGDDALTQAIIKLRKALGDEAHRPTYIETISKRGYRLIAPVTHDKSPVQRGADALPVHSVPRSGVMSPARRRQLLWAGVAVLALALVALGVFQNFESGRPIGESWPPGRGGGSSAPPIIAVLPLSNQSGDSTRDYFSDGMTEDIINALGRYSGLRVISRNSVEPYRNRPTSTEAIRGELGASYVVKGSVREADGKLRVWVELSDVEKGIVIWSERYDGEGKDVFDIQDRITRNIVGTLAVKVTRLELERASRKAPASLEAYELVLRARALVVRSERVANRQARAFADKALQVAPDYAEAHVVLCEAEYQRFGNGWTEDPEETVRRAEQHCLRALAIDDPGARARAHGQLGVIYSAVGKLDQALVEAERAIKLNPSDAFALDTRGSTLMWLGRTEEAITAMETGFRFNPAGRGQQSAFDRALAYYTLRRYSEALATADAALVQHPDAVLLHVIRAATLAQSGNDGEARSAAAQVTRLAPFFSSTEFGNRFVNPQHAAHLQDGLRKAGL
jgi:TolB-like protein/DNA-binding winged helix-turn-helix (wHTH) protein/Flp pilus assembly protein TadD